MSGIDIKEQIKVLTIKNKEIEEESKEISQLIEELKFIDNLIEEKENGKEISYTP